VKEAEEKAIQRIPERKVSDRKFNALDIVRRQIEGMKTKPSSG
jgi:hypothetical protein